MAGNKADRQIGLLSFENIWVINGLGMAPTDPAMGTGPDGEPGIVLQVEAVPYEIMMIGQLSGEDPGEYLDQHTSEATYIINAEYAAIMVAGLMETYAMRGRLDMFLAAVDQHRPAHRKTLIENPDVGTLVEPGFDV